MDVSLWVWAITLTAMVGVLAIDLVVIGRDPHEPSLRESSLWVAGYVALAVAFGVAVAIGYGPTYSVEFFTGWLTEYSLSVDNLFVFVIIMAQFAVPRAYQQKVLMVGIVLALVMRAGFIAVGGAVISEFEWVFYLFGAFLVYTAVKLGRQGDVHADFRENRVITWSRRLLPVSSGYDGARVTTRENGRWRVTPMLMVMISLGTTDLIFAVDSTPAIFGVTKHPYLVFCATVFALMGLRQLYFLLGGLLDRLVYLSIGLAFVLGFIGLKLILDALHGNELSFLNHGRGVGWAPHLPIWLSLLVIGLALSVSAVASLVKSRGGLARDAMVVPAVAGAGRALSHADRRAGDAGGTAGVGSVGDREQRGDQGSRDSTTAKGSGGRESSGGWHVGGGAWSRAEAAAARRREHP